MHASPVFGSPGADSPPRARVRLDGRTRTSGNNIALAWEARRPPPGPAVEPVDIAGLSPASVLKALYDGARNNHGNGAALRRARVESGLSAPVGANLAPPVMPEVIANHLVESSTYHECIGLKTLKVEVKGPVLDAAAFNRANGASAAQAIIARLRQAR